jgi:hypothetical protein
MTNNTISIEPILKSIEIYTTTSIQLYKLYIVDFIANIYAELYTKLILIVLLVSCILFFSIGLSLWLGELLGKNYFGFLTVSGIYFMIALVVLKFKQCFINDPAYNRTARNLK